MNAAANRRVMLVLCGVAVGMFGFGFALVPLYRTLCQIVGINDLGRPAAVANARADEARLVTVEFDANTRDLPWRFTPLQRSLVVHPGQVVHALYEVANVRDRPVSGQAIPSFGPQFAAQYFHKLECFCFARQTLAAGETRRLPVAFVVDRALPAEVRTITLSYTFFEVEGGAGSEGGTR